MRLTIVLLSLAVAGCVTVPTPEPTAGDAAAMFGYALQCATPPAVAWAEPCLTHASPNESPSKAEIDVAVDPTNAMNVVVSSKDLDPLASNCVWAVPQVSKDAGATWTTVYIGGTSASRAPTDPLFGWQCVTDPIMAFAADGTLYYSLQAYDHTIQGSDLPQIPGIGNPIGTVGSAIFAARSNDGGLTWNEIVPLHVGDGANIFHDYMRVLVNPATGTYHTIWNQFTGPATVVPVLVSWDGTSAKGNPPTYVPVPERARGTTMAGFAANTAGTLFVLIEDGDDAWFTSSQNDGLTFDRPVLIPELHGERIERQLFGSDSFRTTGSYELVVDNTGGPRDGWLYATISDCQGSCNIYVSHSEDDGGTWSEKTLVNGGPHAEGAQWIPRPYVDRLGAVHIVYFDTSRGGEKNLIDASWAVSTDGGSTWNNTYLTATPFDGNLGIHQDGFAFIGDYNGIGGAGDWVYMGFPTTVTGRAEIAVAKVKIPST